MIGAFVEACRKHASGAEQSNPRRIVGSRVVSVQEQNQAVEPLVVAGDGAVGQSVQEIHLLGRVAAAHRARERIGHAGDFGSRR